VRVDRRARFHSEPLVVACDEVRHERVGVVDRRDVLEPKFFDEPILQHAVGPFHAAFGLRRVRSVDLDEFAEARASFARRVRFGPF